MSQKTAPAGLVFLGPLADAQDLVKTVAINADGYQHRDVFYFAAPAALENDTVHVDIRMLAGDLLVAPLLYVLVDLLV